MTDDLHTLRGVGDVIAERLRAVGFESAEDVLEADVDELTEADGVGESTAKAILEGDPGGYKGRPSKLKKYHDDIMDAAERGLTYEGIARVAGVGVSTLREWRDTDPKFDAQLEQRRAIGESRLVDRVVEEKPEFILERSYDYIKTERREVEGEHEHRVEGDGFVVEFGDGDGSD